MARHFRFWTFLILLVVVGRASAEECTVSVTKGAPLDVRDSVDGAVTRTLPDGLTVYPMGDIVNGNFVDAWAGSKWAYVQSFIGESLGLVDRQSLKCRRFKTDKRYPLVISASTLLELGLDFSDQKANQWNACPTFSCSTLNVSPSRLSQLKKTRTQLASFCLVSQVTGFRFDPETAQRLPSFVQKENLDFPDEYPLAIPSCMRNLSVKNIRGAAYSTMSLKGCNTKFNPFTGRAISAADKAVLSNQGIFTGGGCGGAPSEMSLASVKGKLPASKAEIQSLQTQVGD